MIHPARNIFDAIELPNHGAAEMFARLESAAQNAATSAFSRTQPTHAQRMASDYVMGEVVLHGIPVRIECPRNTWREGVAPDGKPWRTRLAAHYGDFPGTRGNDGDPVDGFFGPFPESTVVWVINQRHIGGNRFDEHKAMVGFVSEQQARGAYMDSFDRGWTGLMSIVRATVGQFKQWLKSGDKSHPFSVDQPLEGNRIMDKVLWNTQAEPVTTTLHRLMYDLRVSDGKDGLMLDSATMADLMGDPDIDGVMALDALVVEVNRMSVKMDMLKKVMEAAGGTVKPTEVTISDPVKSRGVLQVMVLFQMSDGQTIAIWFHNPDTTPAKLMPLDELISWKWMLNKKDVTIVVAPERGKELNVREVARRVMRLVERNSEAYQKANAKAGERAAESAALDTEITGLESELTDLNRQIDVAQIKAEEQAAKDAEAAAAKQPGGVVAKYEIGVTRASTGRWNREGDLTVRNAGDGLYEWITQTSIQRSITNDVANAFEWLAGVLSGMGEAFTGNELDRAKVLSRLKFKQGEDLLNQFAPAVVAPVVLDIDPTTVEGYHQIWGGGGNDALKLKYQDTLDALFQSRIIETRNALREIGWDGEQMGALSRNDATLEVRIEHAGPGSNIAGITYYVTGNVKTAAGDGLRDDLSLTPQELAKELDTAVSLWSAEETEARRAGTFVEPEVVTPDPAPEPEAGPIATVNAAYLFASASDVFKLEVAGSVEEADYSTFATAKAMDLKAKELGMSIAWDMAGAVLDGIGQDDDDESEEEEDDDFDENEEWEATPESDEDGEEVETVMDGDFKGHPFRGNQYKKASHESSGAVRSSIRAKHAERKGDKKAASKAHAAAYYSHKAASVSASGKAKKYHKKMAKFHGGRSGKRVLDTALLDDASAVSQMVIGRITLGAEVIGRAYVGGDGKAMVYTGTEGNERVKHPTNPAIKVMWSDDDATDMVAYLAAGTSNAPAADPNIGREWDSPYGRQRIESVVGGDLYEVRTVGTDSVRRYSVSQIESIIQKDEHRLTPEYQKELEEQAEIKRLRDENQARADERTAAINAEIKAFTDSKGMSAPNAERARLALVELVRHDGNIMSRKTMVEDLVAAGRFIGQADGKRALENGEGSFMMEKNTTKTGMDYAEYLIAKRPAPEPEKKEETVTPEPINPAPTETENPAKAADTAYLQSLVDGTADMFAADVFERLEPMFASYEADADMMALLERAAQAYGDAAVKAAQAALATA